MRIEAVQINMIIAINGRGQNRISLHIFFFLLSTMAFRKVPLWRLFVAKYFRFERFSLLHKQQRLNCFRRLIGSNEKIVNA